MRSVRSLFTAIVAIGCAASIGALLLVRTAATELVSPRRRALQNYHHEWLDDPASHGIRIRAMTCLDGQVPCLVTEADPKHGPGSRGLKIREQLAGEGVNLPTFGDTRANLVLLHGRQGRKEDLLPIAERFSAVGFRCIMPDLPAHGESPLASVNFGGSPFESGIPSAILREVASTRPAERLPSAIWGISMGGAYAVSAASRHPEDWYSLVIVSSFDSLDVLLEEQCQRRVGPFGAALASGVRQRALRRTGLDVRSLRPVDWAQGIHIPVLVAHGRSDALISPARGRSLFEGFGSRKKEWIDVEHGDHDNVLVTPMPLYARMARWLIQHLPGTRPCK
jgi:alpha-beta hydrolase superfamily lysophospholipase